MRELIGSLLLVLACVHVSHAAVHSYHGSNFHTASDAWIFRGGHEAMFRSRLPSDPPVVKHGPQILLHTRQNLSVTLQRAMVYHAISPVQVPLMARPSSRWTGSGSDAQSASAVGMALTKGSPALWKPLYSKSQRNT